MMTRKVRLLPVGMIFAAAIAFLAIWPVHAQNLKEQAPFPPDTKAPAAPEKTAPAAPEKAAPAPAQAAPAKTPLASPILVKAAETAAATPPDRAKAYYHYALANSYEDEASAEGHPELVNKAIEEFKYALNADPASAELQLGLADLYFRDGRAREAESTVRLLLKSQPENIDAHKLLGRIYLRALSEGQNAPATEALSGDMLAQAIAEFEKIVTLEPKSVDERMVLGQLYTVKHDPKKAEEQFKIARALEPDSEEVVLNLARLYAESGDLENEAKVLEAVPMDDRSPRMETALGGAYEQLKRNKDAIAAFRRAVDMERDPHTVEALAQALLNDGQLDEALKQYRELADADPENVGVLVHIGEIERRQGKYEDALTTTRKAREKEPENLEAGYNEGLLLDVLGRFDESARVFEKMVDLTSHANGAYNDEEKSNRSVFLERLGQVYHEQNKTDEAIAAYQKLIDMGGEWAVHGYQSQVDTWRDVKEYGKAVDAAQKAVDANPKDREMKLMLAGELSDLGKTDEGLALAKGLLNNSNDDRQTWIAVGQICVRAHRWKEAEEAFNKAETLTTKKEDRLALLFFRGELAERQKHYEPAEQLFRKALEIDSDNAMTLNYLGYMLADKNKQLPDALKMIRKAVELDPMNGAYLDSLGWAYFRLGQYELAEENLRQALERDASDPTVHDHMGELYEKTGRIRLAAAQWELSLAQYAKTAAVDVEPGEVAKVQKKLDAARVKLAKQENALGVPVKPE